MKVVFTNGVFDVLHRGHIELLSFCKQQGDYLIVAVDADERVRQNKGECRPFNKLEDRKFLLESLKVVDKVVSFDSLEELRSLHDSIRPDIVVKGSDWSEEHLRQTDGILSSSTVLRYPLVDSYSSTKIIEKLRMQS